MLGFQAVLEKAFKIKRFRCFWTCSRNSLKTTCGDGCIDVKKRKISARKWRISGLFRKLGLKTQLLKRLGFLIWKHIYCENVCQVVTSDQITQIECVDQMSGIFEKVLKSGNQSGNSILKAFSDSGLDVREGVLWQIKLLKMDGQC